MEDPCRVAYCMSQYNRTSVGSSLLARTVLFCHHPFVLTCAIKTLRLTRRARCSRGMMFVYPGLHEWLSSSAVGECLGTKEKEPGLCGAIWLTASCRFSPGVVMPSCSVHFMSMWFYTVTLADRNHLAFTNAYECCARGLRLLVTHNFLCSGLKPS